MSGLVKDFKFETSATFQNTNDPNGFDNLNFGFVSDWSETDASPDIWI